MMSYFFRMHTIDVVVTIRTITSPAMRPTMMNNTVLFSFGVSVFAVCKSHLLSKQTPVLYFTIRIYNEKKKAQIFCSSQCRWGRTAARWCRILHTQIASSGSFPRILSWGLSRSGTRSMHLEWLSVSWGKKTREVKAMISIKILLRSWDWENFNTNANIYYSYKYDIHMNFIYISAWSYLVVLLMSGDTLTMCTIAFVAPTRALKNIPHQHRFTSFT